MVSGTMITAGDFVLEHEVEELKMAQVTYVSGE